MPPETLRQQNKSEKLRRIRKAAQDLFATQGFDSTSTREIAAEARVGLATLFLYASDKRDLLFLACNDDLEALTETAFADIDPDAPVLDQLVAAFQHFFVFYGRNKQLSRDLLRELTFFTTGQQSARFQVTRQTTIGKIESLVSMARSQGKVRSPSADSEIAEVIFYVFAAEVRRWLASDESSPEMGLAHFKRLLHVVIAGLDVGSNPANPIATG